MKQIGICGLTVQCDCGCRFDDDGAFEAFMRRAPETLSDARALLCSAASEMEFFEVNQSVLRQMIKAVLGFLSRESGL